MYSACRRIFPLPPWGTGSTEMCKGAVQSSTDGQGCSASEDLRDTSPQPESCGEKLGHTGPAVSLQVMKQCSNVDPHADCTWESNILRAHPMQASTIEGCVKRAGGRVVLMSAGRAHVIPARRPYMLEVKDLHILRVQFKARFHSST